jgi:hypothetical protein
VLGETTPSLPLYLGEALAVEAAALVLARRQTLAFGGVAGFLAGTAGFAVEWGWTHLTFRLPWDGALLPEGVVLAAVAGTAGGVLGALIGMALLGRLPRPAVARPAAALASLALVAVLADGLYETAPRPVRAALTMTSADERGRLPADESPAATRGVRGSGRGGGVHVTARLDPRGAADAATWLTVTAWQGDGLVVDRLVPDGAGGWRTTRAIPVDGDWKVQLRLQTGRNVLGVPVRLPADPAIPAREVPVQASVDRAFVPDRTLLQRERKGDVPGWLWGGASAVVIALALALLGALAWGLGRVARHGPPAPAARTPSPPPPRLAARASRAGV